MPCLDRVSDAGPFEGPCKNDLVIVEASGRVDVTRAIRAVAARSPVGQTRREQPLLRGVGRFLLVDDYRPHQSSEATG